MSPSAESVRLFVALWPDAAVRARLAAFAEAWDSPAGARRVDAANLHVTLHFIGAFARDDLGALGHRLAAVAPRRVDLRPAGCTVWRGGIGVLTLVPEPALVALHRETGEALADHGIALETRPFRPHVTLARKAEGAAPPGDPPVLDWRAAGFSLVESRRKPPVRYERLAAWGEPALGVDARSPPGRA